MKGLAEWDDEEELWTPLLGVFQSSGDAGIVVSEAYSSLWLARHWTHARQDGVAWNDFIRAGILKYRPQNGDVWRPEELDGQGSFKTLLSYSTACLVCRDFGVVQSVLTGSYIYRSLVRCAPCPEPDIPSLVRDARVLHL